MAKKKKETPEERTAQLDELLKRLDEAEKEYTEKLKLADLENLLAQLDAKNEK